MWILIDSDGNTTDGWHGADKAIAVRGPDGSTQFYSWAGSVFQPQVGSGLSGLVQRVSTVDGRIDVSSPPGGPTVVTVVLPMKA